MTHSIGDEVQPVKGSETARPREAGPDPVVGAGISLLGIFLMGTGGASNSHYLFDAGVAIAVLGAGIFVLFVTLSALKQRAAGRDPS